MRIVASLHAADRGKQQEALADVCEVFKRHGLIESDDAVEQRDIIQELMHDMLEIDRSRFQRSLRIVSKHTVDRTVAGICLFEQFIVIRLRHPQLSTLMPYGQALLEDLLSTKGAEPKHRLILHSCEIRERGNDIGFLFGTWSAGEPSLLRYMYGQRRAFIVCVTFLFVAGLILEVIIPAITVQTPMVDLGLRLGAPMLVSSSVIMLERWAYWLRERTPRIRWSPEHGRRTDEKVFSPGS